MHRRGWGAATLTIVLLGCGASAQGPATATTTATTEPTTTPTATDATPPATVTATEPTVAAPAHCVQAAECCRAYVATLGIDDAAVQSRACAPFSAPVWDARFEDARCATQITIWNEQRAMLGATAVPACAPPPPPVASDAPPAPRRVHVQQVEVDEHVGSFVVRASDIATVERVLGSSLAVCAYAQGIGDARALTPGPTLALPDGSRYARALTYRATRRIDPSAPETDETIQLVVLVGATESRVIIVPAADDSDQTIGPLSAEIDGGALHLTWTASRTGVSESYRWAQHPELYCGVARPAEQLTIGWEARCDLGPDPHCDYAPTTERTTPDPAPTFSCVDGDGRTVPGPTTTPSAGRTPPPLTFQLVVGQGHAVVLGESGEHPDRLHTSTGELTWVCDDDLRARVARRDPDLLALESDMEVGYPENFIERRELPDFALLNGGDASGTWFGVFARDQGTWAEVTPTFVDTLALGESASDEDDGFGRTAYVPIALDVVPGGASEVLVPIRCDTGADPYCSGLLVCGAVEGTTRCRALPIRARPERTPVVINDSLRFDLAGHLVLHPHRGPAATIDLATWLAEPDPSADP